MSTQDTPKPLATSANVRFYNDWPKSIVVQRTKNVNMNEDYSFPEELTIPFGSYKPQDGTEIKAGILGGQSYFELTFNPGSRVDLGINNGRGFCETKIVKKTGILGESCAILAPVNPGEVTKTDFFFWFHAGSDQLVEVVNSAINVNLVAVVDWINRQHFAFSLFDQDVVIEGVTDAKLSCNYCSSSKPLPSKDIWNSNINLIFTGKFKASGITFTMTNFSALMKLNMDLTTKEPKVKATTLQCMVDKLNVDPPFFDPVVWLAEYYVPAVVNTTYNAEILKKINDELAKLFKKSSDSTTATNAGEEMNARGDDESLEPDLVSNSPSETIPEIGPAGEFTTWMSKPQIQSKKLHQLKLPGTHDSAAYLFKQPYELCDKPGELAFLWDLKPGSAPIPWDPKQKEKYLGGAAYSYVFQQVFRLAQTHDESKTIKRQMEDGIRCFDIRLYYSKKDDAVFTEHTLKARSLEDIISQIKSFIDANSASAEFFIFQIWQGWFDRPEVPKEVPARIAKLIQDKIGNSVYYPPTASPSERFDFQNLTNTVLSEVTQGKPKVLFVNTDAIMYPKPVLNANNFLPDKPGGANPPPGFRSIWFSKTPDEMNMLKNILINTGIKNPALHRNCLRIFSKTENVRVKKSLEQDTWATAFYTDWYTESDGELPVPLIIKANFT